MRLTFQLNQVAEEGCFVFYPLVSISYLQILAERSEQLLVYFLFLNLALIYFTILMDSIASLFPRMALQYDYNS